MDKCLSTPKAALAPINWRWRRLYRWLIHKTCSKIYFDTVRDTGKSAIVAGTARSGTTWLAEIIASQYPCRIMFEPFHSRKVAAFQEFNYFQYMRPTEQNNALFSYCQNVFSGDIRDNWIDRQVEHVFPKYRLIKEIRANLFLNWMHHFFPEIPILFIVRHPCAVVLSRMQLGWATDEDIDSFLCQTRLIDDFLIDHLDVIRGATTTEEKHAVIWCVSNLVPIRQFGPGSLNTVFYENLTRDPMAEIPKIFRLLNHRYRDNVFAIVDRPSITSRSIKAIGSGNNQGNDWKSRLSPRQIEKILSVVERFHLDYIYGDSSEPLVTAL
jgi:Sulfotransferase family